MTAANGHMERFHHNLGIHHRDVSLLEDTRKLISACKVKIQSEINKSDSTFKKVCACVCACLCLSVSVSVCVLLRLFL